MKHKTKIITILFIAIYCIFLFSPSKVNADTKIASSFLEFEQSLLKLDDNDLTNSPVSLNLETNDNTDELKEFSLKSLIVKGVLNNTYGAKDRVSFNNLHILTYKTTKETQYAYQQLVSDPNLRVIIDKIETNDGYSSKDYNYDSYQNWALQSIDVAGYREFLVDNKVDKEVVVVVLDTGINTSHSMFTNRLLTNNDGKIHGFSYYNSTYKYSYNNLAFDTTGKDINTYSFEDDNGHGTHVAGIITQLTPENVKILPIKIGGKDGKSTTRIMIAAYLRVIEIYSKQYTIVATNLSFSGGGKDSEDERDTFNEQCYQPLLDLNILPITAAGNENAKIDIEGLKAIVVSSLEKTDVEYKFDNSYSNYGKIIDIAAPGSNISSAGIASIDKSDSSIVKKSGTSMASPQVAGVVALLYLNPDLNENVKATEIEQLLYDITLDMGSPGKDSYYGEGMLNLKYFDVTKSETLMFYKDGNQITDYINNINFDEPFNFEIVASNPDFTILFTTNKTLPTLSNHLLYENPLIIDHTTKLYVMGVKIVNNEIVQRTDLYNVSYFLSSTPIWDVLSISPRGYLTNYSGNFTKLIIPSSLNGVTITGIEPSTFKNSNLEYVVLPETITTIAGYAFQGSKNLKFIYAPEVSKIFIAGFEGCESLKFISDNHPASNATEGAFFPKLKETVGFTFSNCHNLESVSLSAFSTFGDNGYDFQNCEKLRHINLPSITSIPEGTFVNCSNIKDTFHITKSVKNVSSKAFTYTKIRFFSVDKENDYFYSDGIGLYSTNSFIVFAPERENFNYEILSLVPIKGVNYLITTIESRAFYDIEINSITIPYSINTINGFAFYNTEINTLYYNAQNCNYAGYYDPQSYSKKIVFYKINTLIIGEKVKSVPMRLFQDVYFDTLVINSKSTTFASTSLYRQTEQGDLDKLVLNFNDSINYNYLTMITQTSALTTFANIKNLYSKTKVDVTHFDLRNLIYSYTYKDYILYSENDIDEMYEIDISYNEYGYILYDSKTHFKKGDSQTYTFVANPGYKVDKILIDGVSLNKSELESAIEKGYTFSKIEANHTIKAIFSPVEYTITYIDREGNPISISAPNSYTFEAGVTLPTDINKEGYALLGWYDNPNLEGEKVTKINKFDYGDKVYYAKLETQSYTITIIKTKNGTINVDKLTYNYLETAHFEILPDFGYHISYLIIDKVQIEVSNNSYTLSNISDNHTISAVFAPNVYKITYKDIEENIIDSISLTIYLYGIESALPNNVEKEGYCFIGWYDNKNLEGEKITSIKKFDYGDKVYYAKFEIKKFTVNIQSIKDNDIVCEDTLTYEYGENLKVIFNYYKGYSVFKLLVNNNDTTKEIKDNSYSIENIHQDYLIVVYFETTIYTIKTIINGNGIINPNGDVLINEGHDKTFYFFPYNGHIVSKIYVDEILLNKEDTLLATQKGYMFTNVNSNHTIKVVFAKETFKVEIEIVGKGTYKSESDLESVGFEKNIAIDLLPDENYKIDSVWVNDEFVYVENNQPLLLEVIDNTKVKIVFKEEKKEEIKVDNNQTQNQTGGLSCSKNSATNNIYDLIFIVVSLFSFALLKRKS